MREFGQALEKDPYNPETTLKLALAYDRVARKGCALALLGRLEKLSEHPQFTAAATAQIDDVSRLSQGRAEGRRPVGLH